MKSSKLSWCEKCNMETCWLWTAISLKDADWRCDRCQRKL